MSLDGKRVLITGANGGLGLATAVGVLREGASVVLACRTEAKADGARDRAVAQAPAASEYAEAAGGFDMLDPASIVAAVRALPPTPFDVVFLQAGGWVVADTMQSVDLGDTRVERTVAQNVVGAHVTLRALWETDRLCPGARVVMIGGEGARGVPGGIAKPTFRDLQDFRGYLAGDATGRGPYVPMDALGTAKFCAALWVKHLARHTQNALEVVWFTPGLIGGTGGTRGLPAWKEFLFQRVAFPLLVTLGKAQWPTSAAAKCVDCLAGRVGSHGELIGAPEGTALGPLTEQTAMHPLFTDERFQRALWRHCELAGGALPLVDRNQRSVT